MNPFETGKRKVIPAVLIYPRRGDQLLMLHRNAKAHDYHEGKWNGLGGKCELDESFLEAAVRELEEEAGLKLPAQAFEPLGTLQFPNFKPHKSEDWLVAVFSVDVPTGSPGGRQVPGQASEPWPRGPEGDLKWIPSKEVLNLNLWRGDREFLPFVIGRRPFAGCIWYQGEEVTKFWIRPLGSGATGPL